MKRAQDVTGARSARRARSATAATAFVLWAGPGIAAAEPTPAPAEPAVEVPAPQGSFQDAVEASLGPFKINEADPISSVPSPAEAIRRPLEMGYHVVELTSRAGAAAKRGDHAKAGEYYMAVAKASPDRAIGFSKACEEFQAAGNTERALAVCRRALGKEGVTSTDFLRYVQLALQKEGTLNREEIADVEAVIERVEKESSSSEAGRRQAITLRCQVAVKLEDGKRLAACAREVMAWPANDPQRFVFRSLSALHQGDFEYAQRLIHEGRRAGIDAGVLERAQKSLDARRKAAEGQQGSAAGSAGGGGGTWPMAGAVGLALAAVLAFVMGRKRVRAKLV